MSDFTQDIEQDRAYCRRHRQRISLSDGCPDCDADSRECAHCVHYRAGHRSALVANPTGPYCAIERPLVPCDFYEREPGADDD